ncbi:hypothetical protein CHI12_16335 [Terribacillus saccharophilus]|uniref:LysE type translocator n=1 Tax=Terribacillus saccharophilus TaxID=361277 RepID=A0A268H9B8_9BACI|nr:hypothetical protein CHI12_16335 [Terribacillus saccharophilus]
MLDCLQTPELHCLEFRYILFDQVLLKHYSIAAPFFVLGAVYLLFIAYKIMFDKSKKEEDAIERPSFLSGFLFQLINIKSILYFITAMATFILPFKASVSSIILYAAVTIIIGCLGLLLWAAFGSAFKKFFNKYTRSINLIMCLLLIFSAISIFK